MNDRNTGAEEAVTSQNFITRARLVFLAAHWAETTAVPAVGEVLRRDLLPARFYVDDLESDIASALDATIVILLGAEVVPL